jgi:rhamnogalacturonan acetylesterase
VTEVVQTFPTYIKNASSIFLAKGAAGIILSSQNPTNVWEPGNYSYTPDMFPYYQEYSLLPLSFLFPIISPFFSN